MSPTRLVAYCMTIASLTACEREARHFQVEPPLISRHTGVTDPGQPPPSPAELAQPNPSDENAYDVGQGETLYIWFNCVGCHANGGGGMGPPLMDATWRYGARPGDIYATIIEGRPNGMPSFRGRIPDNQVWQLVAYVRSMSGLIRRDARPGRMDHMAAKRPESMTPQQGPRPEHPRGGQR